MTGQKHIKHILYKRPNKMHVIADTCTYDISLMLSAILFQSIAPL